MALRDEAVLAANAAVAEGTHAIVNRMEVSGRVQITKLRTIYTVTSGR